MKLLTGLMQTPNRLAPLLLSGLIMSCGEGTSSSGFNFFPEDCLGPGERIIEDFCDGCPQGWTPISIDTDVAGVCCEEANGNLFWLLGEQCPANTSWFELVTPEERSVICFDLCEPPS